MADRVEITLPGGTVSYLAWTPPDPSFDDESRPTLVLLHGGGVDSAALSWGAIGDALAAGGYRVVAPDAPGYGHSPLPGWPSTQANLVAYVGQFVDALGLDRFVLGGLSMGGAMTLGYTLAHRKRVRGIIPMGSGGIMDRQRDAWWARGVHAVTWLSVRGGLMDATFRLFADSRKLTEWSLAQIVRDPAQRPPELLDAVMAEGARASGATAFGQWQRDQILVDRIKDNYVPRVAGLGVPALVIHGERDTGVPLARARELADALGARLVVAPDAGHWVPRDAPALVIEEVLRFMDGLVAASE